MSNYLCYWLPDTVRRDLGQDLDHAGGEQLRKVRSGDHLWVVTYDQKKLFLCGHQAVDAVVSQRQAERRLKSRDLWDATYHTLTAPKKAERIRLVDITSLAKHLRFSGTVDRLPVNFSPANLQSMRLLTPESAALLSQEWYGSRGRNLLGLLQQEANEAEQEKPFIPQDLEDARRRILREIVSRQGQQQFRSVLLNAYNNRCAISGCEVVAVLEAAHIFPYRGDATNHASNGLLLRGDLHTLFDLGLIGVNAANHQVLLASELLKSDYAQFAGKTLNLPSKPGLRPSKAALDWHRKAFGLE